MQRNLYSFTVSANINVFIILDFVVINKNSETSMQHFNPQTSPIGFSSATSGEKNPLDLLVQFILYCGICQHLKVESQTLAPNLVWG